MQMYILKLNVSNSLILATHRGQLCYLLSEESRHVVQHPKRKLVFLPKKTGGSSLHQWFFQQITNPKWHDFLGISLKLRGWCFTFKNPGQNDLGPKNSRVCNPLQRWLKCQEKPLVVYIPVKFFLLIWRFFLSKEVLRICAYPTSHQQQEVFCASNMLKSQYFGCFLLTRLRNQDGMSPFERVRHYLGSILLPIF